MLRPSPEGLIDFLDEIEELSQGGADFWETEKLLPHDLTAVAILLEISRELIRIVERERGRGDPFQAERTPHLSLIK